MKQAAPAMLVASLLLATGRPAAQQPGSPSAVHLVGTWTLATTEIGVDRDAPVMVQNPRGLLVFDAARPVFEVVTQGPPTTTTVTLRRLSSEKEMFATAR